MVKELNFLSPTPPGSFDMVMPIKRISLEELVNRHALEITPKALNFSKKGYIRMESSRDPTHSAQHIDRLIFYLNGFLTAHPEHIKSINFNELLIALTWHDVWKTENYGNNSKI